MWPLLGMTCPCRQVKQQHMAVSHHARRTCMGTAPVPPAWHLDHLHTVSLAGVSLPTCCELSLLAATAALSIWLMHVMPVAAAGPNCVSVQFLVSSCASQPC